MKINDLPKKYFGGWWLYKRTAPRTASGVKSFLTHQLDAFRFDRYQTYRHLANFIDGRTRLVAAKLENDLTAHDAAELFVFSLNEKQSPLVALLSETIAGFMRATEERQVYELVADAFNKIFKAPTLRIFERRVNEEGEKQKRLALERSNGKLLPSPFRDDWQNFAADSGSAKLDAADDLVYPYSYIDEKPADFEEMVNRYPNVSSEKLKLVFYKFTNGDIHLPFAEMWELYTDDFSENDLRIKKLVVQLASMSIKRIREEAQLSALTDQLAGQSLEARLLLTHAMHAEVMPGLTVIKGYLDLVRRQLRKEAPEAAEKVRGMLGNIDATFDRLLAKLRERILEAHKGRLKINLKLTDVNLSRSIEGLLSEHRKLVAEGVRPAVEISAANVGADVIAHCDPDLVTDVIRELFNNALKALKHRHAPRLTISLKKRAESNVLFTLTNPAEIEREDLDGLFDGRADASRPDSSGGGLFSSRLLIEKLGGKMWAEKLGDELAIKFTLPAGLNLSS
ncbi:hypothetical protein A2625_06740 [candidate division WOR-1 bacterium RIFCSPHIGHO2_01_FULL_53_15]|uniref:histidine kinase n=1 Tax=candidate division WOR-1 bacterium RIFCSPHIGHO2_01_FULL_53_15 TaxID=1802564 RepID=A0A1F4Q4M3_UNCSA|nr:MAG: hypothetical protein A2625_06740 [candidate division WOR-1 bacterium RIFCSPHIGHO2_01_FULL_53_15]OGC10301.1 MAG: hypothetical protein A3D23_06745 [candidate division WOR-1 bacterium RIFCSPHIGHO2_02_FULL_53_26]